MVYKSILPSFLLSLLFLGLAHIADASIIGDDLFIDFRSSDWAQSYGQKSYTVGNVTAGAFRDLPSSKQRRLYQDSVDGLGVLGGQVSSEINRNETLRVFFDFDQSIHTSLTGVWLTDLNGVFGNSFGEVGQATLTVNSQDSSYNFFGGYANQINGDFWLEFTTPVQLSDIDQIVFSSASNRNNNAFSVAGFTSGDLVATPEPASMILIATGLAGAAFSRRRKIKMRLLKS